MIDITVRVTEDGATIYGGTIEVSEKKDAKKLANDVREAVAEILIKYSNPEDDSNIII